MSTRKNREASSHNVPDNVWSFRINTHNSSCGWHGTMSYDQVPTLSHPHQRVNLDLFQYWQRVDMPEIAVNEAYPVKELNKTQLADELRAYLS